MITVFRGGRIFDGSSDSLIEGIEVVVEGDRIVALDREAALKADRVIDLHGRTLMPGLIDAHVHVYAAELDLTRAMRRPFTYLSHYAARFLRHMLSTGFTTVRDVGGADHGLVRAIADGLIEGPRLFHGGRVLSQTGGHADWRPGGEEEPGPVACSCGLIDQRTAVLADGVDQVLQAAREEFRRGARHIKIMASGGVASPSDPLTGLQYSPAEIRAVVEEAERHGRYVAAHCHPAEAIRRCAELGVRTIEHATLIDEPTAQIVVKSGAFVVPTLAVIDAFSSQGPALGLPQASQEKLKVIARHAQRSLEIVRDAKIPVGFGTDLLGPLHERNLTEFTLRKDVFTPVEILRSATSINARILQSEGELGCIAPGAYADLIVVDGDPLQDLNVMLTGRAGMPIIMKAGDIIRNDLG
jgi:imidazolonepropionase-like amidohydrolase